MRKLLLLGIVVGLVGIDAAVKWAVHAHLPLMSHSLPFYPYGGIGVFESVAGIQFSITHATNTGTIWGLFPNAPAALVAIRLAIIGGLMVYLMQFNRDRGASWPLLLILAGATGNVLDFFLYGHVVDMFHVRLWGWSYPIFNLADSAICIGVLWLVGRSLWSSGHASETRA